MGASKVPPVMKMAIEIADQFRHVPPIEAAVAIAEHICLFWDPRMRAQLMEHVAQEIPGVDAHVAATVSLLEQKVRSDESGKCKSVGAASITRMGVTRLR